jgi:two-component system, OmpR family, sensor histidine kinase CiaH
MLSILGAFSWWMYALLNYGRIELDLRKQAIADESRVMQNSLVEHVLRGVFDTGYVTVFKHGKGTYKANIPMMEDMVRRRSHGKMELQLKDAVLLEHRVNVEVTQEALDQMYHRYEYRRNRFLAEGAIISVLVLVSFIWLMIKFNNVVSFNQQQNNFLLAITHELKTPVAAVKLALQTLGRPSLPPEKREALITAATSNTDRLDELMNNVLLATRIEGKAYRFERLPVDLGKLLDTVRNQATCVHGFKGEIQLNVEKDLYVNGDLTSLSLAFHNLLNNAIKYGDSENPIVAITGYRQGNNVLLEVADNGRGVPDDEKKKIFQKFYRVGNEAVRSSKGTGLGLYLVRKILYWHHADIRAEDNKPGGTVFKVVFRL